MCATLAGENGINSLSVVVDLKIFQTLRFVRSCPGTCCDFGVLAESCLLLMMSLSMLLRVIPCPSYSIHITLQQLWSFSELVGVISCCPAILQRVFLSLGMRHLSIMDSRTCCMFSVIGCFCLQGLHSPPDSSCYPTTIIKTKEAFPWRAIVECGRMACCVRGGGTPVLGFPSHPESFTNVSLAACKVGKGLLGCCGTVCVSVLCRAYF